MFGNAPFGAQLFGGPLAIGQRIVRWTQGILGGKRNAGVTGVAVLTSGSQESAAGIRSSHAEDGDVKP